MMSLARRSALAAVATVAVSLGAAGHASGHGVEAGYVYWANSGSGTVGRAHVDGTAVDQAFIGGGTTPRAVAIDAGHVYWAQGGVGSGAIGRAALDGSAPDQSFLPVGDSPAGLTLDDGRIYWTNVVAGKGAVGRAAFSGAGATNAFVQTSAAELCGVSTDGDEVYFAVPGASGTIGSAHGQFTVHEDLISAGVADPCGVAVAGPYLYWANRGGDSIGRARLDGSEADPAFITTTSAPCGVAVDGSHVWWTTADDTIARAELDGTGVEEDHITGAAGPCGIAVTPTASADPASRVFARTAVGERSELASFAVQNTSSSVLDVGDVKVAGANPGDFVLTGDGCTPNVTQPGWSCFLTARFAPRSRGIRSATLRVTGNQAGGSFDIVVAGRAVGRDVGRAIEVTEGVRGRLEGLLEADEQECSEGQPVKLFRRRVGPDRVVDRTTTSGDGGFAMRVREPGTFYAVAPGSRAGPRDCLRARSEALRL